MRAMWGVRPRTLAGRELRAGEMATKEIVQAVLCGGILCGVLDGLAATVSFRMRGVPAQRVWQNVASGLLGASAFQKGRRSAALGLVLHFTIALGAACVFCLGAAFLPVLLRSPVIAGAVYGIVVFLAMNLVVLPLSAMPKRPFNAAVFVTQLFIHILFVGLPVSLSASRILG
jgi:uncharacterized membrane protein YagU involved in acid resistance